MREFSWEALCRDSDGESRSLAGTFLADAYDSSETKAILEAEAKADAKGFDPETVEVTDVVFLRHTHPTEEGESQ